MTAERRTGTDRRTRRTAERDRLRAIVERMADGVLVVDLDGIIRFANPAAEQLFGRPAAALCGSGFGLPAVGDGAAEIEVRRPTGASVTAELRVVESDWEESPAMLISLRDVTDRKQLERERVARAQAEAADEAKSSFLAIMSHELRTPLNAVLGYAELLDVGSAGPVTPAQHTQLARIHASGHHLLDLVNEMLDLAKAGSGTLAVHSGVANARATALDAIAVVLPLAQSRDITLSEDCDGDAGLTYQGDEHRARQILVHLLDNATKFTRAGGKVRIECDLAAMPNVDAPLDGGGPWARWHVHDTGVGLAPEALGSIFDPFVQVEAGHTRPVDGSGLGLTISRSLARLMRGDITVRSAAGQGSSFTLWLPAVAARPAA